MAKDYKDSPAPRADSRLNHPLLLGVIIGLLLGIVISLAVALWLNRLANPFVEKGKTVEPTPRIAPAQRPPPGQAAKPPGEPAHRQALSEKPAKEAERPGFHVCQNRAGENCDCV